MHEDFFSTVREILKYGGSTFAALVSTSIYMTTDGFFIGNWVGTDGLAAMALVYPVVMIFIAFGTLFETGSSAVVSEKIGANKKNLAEKIMRTNYVVAFVFGIMFSIAGYIFVEQILNFISNGHEPVVTSLAVDYLKISLWQMPFLLTVYLTGAFMRCIGNPTHVFYFVGSTSIINVILDAVFIILFGWGMTGAAFATVMAQMSGALITFWYFKFSPHKLKTSIEIGELEYIWQEIKIGAGFGIATLMMSCIEYFLNFTLLQHEASELLAAAAIGNIILSLILMPLNGLDTGIQPLVSKLYSAKQEKKYLRVMRYGFAMSMTLSFTLYILLMIFTNEIANFFIAEGEVVTSEMVTFLRLLFLLNPFVAVYIWLSGIMAALEDEWRNIAISLTPLVIQVPLIWLLAKIMPIEYVSLAYSLEDIAEATVAFILIQSFFKQKKISFKKIFTSR